MPRPIALYTWRPKSGATVNLGDEVSAPIVEAVSGREVVWSELASADLTATGSILQMLYGVLRGRSEPIHVWGSGVVQPQRLPHRPEVIYTAVRGPLTRGMAELPYLMPMGDPALLAADVWPANGTKDHAVGIVPHFSQLSHPSWRELADRNPRSVIIDVTDPDIAASVRTIARCDLVVSTSLHGLILADAFGVPNVWVQGKDLHKATAFKFYDYLASVGRRVFGPLEVRRPLLDLTRLPHDRIETHHFDAVAALKAGLQAAFPASLRA